MTMNRRDFGKLALAGAAGFAAGPLAFNASAASKPGDDRLRVYVFSKHLQFLNYRDMSEATADLGFDGLDLTVRPGGHVEPARAEEDLPKAVEAMSAHGLDPKMFVSRITNVDDKDGIQSLKTAARLGFGYYRTGYYKPDKDGGLRENLTRSVAEFRKLAAFNKKKGLHGAYQNHSGQSIGSYVTDIVEMLEGLDSRWAGCHYDIRHATVEGGTAWPLGLRYLKSHIKTVPIKDFRWIKSDRKWKVENVPLGQGMVDFDRYFKLLRSYDIRPLVSLHLEYDLGGADHGHREITIPQKEVFAAMKRDLTLLHRMWGDSAE